MDLGFLCEEDVHCCYLGIENDLLSCRIICMRVCLMRRFYLVVLSCMRVCLMRRFYVDDNYDFKKEQNIKD
jgi:hypothetical protein